MWKSKICLVFCTFLFIKTINAACPNGVRARKEVRDLTDAEWKAYVTAAVSLRSASTWDTHTRIHVTEQFTVHGNSWFLPWHRYYLYDLEVKLQAIDSSVMLNYWNWAYDSQAPEASIVLGANRYGGSGSGSGNCVTTGSFANSFASVPNRHCLSRRYDGTTKISGLYSVDVMNAMITNAGKNYTSFRLQLELAHNLVHSNIGGDMSTVATSPNDPLFYAHHTFVDKMWSQWQAVQGSTIIDGVDSRSRTVNADSVLPSYPNVKASGTFSTNDLCYTYQDMVWSGSVITAVPAAAPAAAPASNSTAASLIRRGPTPPSTYIDPLDRKELVNLRQPRPVPEEVLRRNQIDITAARNVEKNFASIIAKINALVGYIPPSCLWLREDLLAKLLDKTSEFQAVVNGVTYKVQIPKTGSVQDRLLHIRTTIREKYGGYLRADPSKYMDMLKSIVGNLVLSRKDSSFEVTLPGVNPNVKV